MIHLNDYITLKEITINNHVQLYDLMCEIYPKEYKYFWKDDSLWYINNQFHKNNLQKELSEENQQYFFVIYKDEVVGILRLLFKTTIKKFPKEKALKLHRVYLHNKVQGKGIGNAILNFVEEKTKEKKHAILWLEAMEKKPLALKFYKNFGFEVLDEYLYEFDLLKKDHQKMIALYKKY